jgi:hypothetical protein
MTEEPRSPEDEHTRVLTAITITDGSIAHHNAELRRLWALRGSLSTRLEQLGTRPPPAPAQDSPGISGPAPSADELGEHIERTAPEPIERPQIGQQLLERMAQAGIEAPPAVDEAPQDSPPATVELLPLNTAIDGSRRYERVLVPTKALPAASFEVWVHDGRIQETHLYRRGNDTPLMVCGFQVMGPESWWRPQPEDFEPQFELCYPCARHIPGAYLRHG